MKILSILFSLLFMGISPSYATILAEAEKAFFPIVIAPNATEETRENAKELADYLTQISGAPFQVETGTGERGIVFGVAKDFPNLPKNPENNKASATSESQIDETYLLYSHPKGVLLVGASDLAAQNALWDFLYRLGYRQYFPGKTWEIIPSLKKIEVSLDEQQSPDYFMRNVWPSGGFYQERSAMLTDWRRKNRMIGGGSIDAGHSYEGIVSKNKEFFTENDYITPEGKPRLWRPEVRAAFVNAFLERAAQRPDAASISVDPSDGGGWDTGAESQAFGSISDQVITLANETAEALQGEHPGMRVGLYAYNYHSAPPAVRVNPHVTVLVATWFRQTKIPLKEQMQAWSKQGATLGTRDYLSYAAMDYDLPARAVGIQSIDRYIASWRNYYQWGSRYYSGEAQENWTINGLLYFAASRVLWNTKEDLSEATLFEEFLTNCYGSVKETIRPYYALLRLRPALDEDLLHQLYQRIEDTRSQTTDPKILERLNDLTLYTRYLELNNRFSENQGNKKVAYGKEMLTHLYRGRMHSVDHAKGIIRDLSARNPTLRGLRDKLMQDTGKNPLRAGIPPWSEDEPLYTDEEIHAFVAEGLKNNQRFSFTVPSYSNELVPAAALAGYASEPEVIKYGASVDNALYYTWAEEKNTEWEIRVTPHRKEEAPVPLRAEIWANAVGDDAPIGTQEVTVNPGEEGILKLTSSHPGLHRIFLHGTKVGDTLELDPRRAWTIGTALDEPVQTMSRMYLNTFYFFVPTGTPVLAVRVNRTGRGNVVTPDGEIIRKIDNEQLVEIEVPSGMDGQFWKVTSWRGNPFSVLTVPPYFAFSPQQLLLPKEVVKKELKSK